MKGKNVLNLDRLVLARTIKKIRLEAVSLMLPDAMFYMISGFLVAFWFGRIQMKIKTINLPSTDQIMSMGYERAQVVLAQTKSFYYFLILSFVLLIVAEIFIYSLLKGVIWARTSKSKLSFHFLGKFLALNLIWLPIWCFLLFAILKFTEIGFVFEFTTIAVGISSYFSLIAYSLFARDPRLKTLKDAVKLGFTRIGFMILPFGVFFGLSYWIVMLSMRSTILSVNYVLVILLLFLMAFARYYFFDLVHELRQQKGF